MGVSDLGVSLGSCVGGRVKSLGYQNPRRTQQIKRAELCREAGKSRVSTACLEATEREVQV